MDKTLDPAVGWLQRQWWFCYTHRLLAALVEVERLGAEADAATKVRGWLGRRL